MDDCLLCKFSNVSGTKSLLRSGPLKKRLPSDRLAYAECVFRHKYVYNARVRDPTRRPRKYALRRNMHLYPRSCRTDFPIESPALRLVLGLCHSSNALGILTAKNQVLLVTLGVKTHGFSVFMEPIEAIFYENGLPVNTPSCVPEQPFHAGSQGTRHQGSHCGNENRRLPCHRC